MHKSAGWLSYAGPGNDFWPEPFSAQVLVRDFVPESVLRSEIQ